MARNTIPAIDAVRIYDNGGKTADRYTAVFMFEPENAAGTFAAIGMDENPFHPQGIGMHFTAMPGPHLGKRIEFKDCPVAVQACIAQDLAGLTVPQFETMVRHYLICAHWSSIEEENPDATFTRAAVMQACEDCLAFVHQCGPLLGLVVNADGYGSHPDCGDVAPNLAAMGHDFWLTRCGYGVGFSDRDALQFEHGMPDARGVARHELCTINGDKTEYELPAMLGDALHDIAYGNTEHISQFADADVHAYNGWINF